MIGEAELVAAIERLELQVLRDWVDRGWIRPQAGDAQTRFDDADVARTRLICELHYELHIAEDSLPVVLSLMDQVYGLRRVLRAVSGALETLPDEARLRVVGQVEAALRRRE